MTNGGMNPPNPRLRTRPDTRATPTTVTEARVAVRALAQLPTIVAAYLTPLAFQAAWDAIEERADVLTARTESVGRTSGPSDPVFGEMARLAPVAADWRNLNSAVLDLVRRANHVSKLLADVRGKSEAVIAIALQAKDAARCTGGGDAPGAIHWGDPLCPNIAVEGERLCLECRPERAAWIADPEGYVANGGRLGRRAA